MELEKAQALDLAKYDCVLAECLDMSGYRDPTTGQWVSFAQNGRRITGKSRKILEVIQNRPGVHLENLTLAELTWEDNITPSDTLRLRRAFGETKMTAHFILTNDGLAWSKNATWMRITMTVGKRISPESSGQS